MHCAPGSVFIGGVLVDQLIPLQFPKLKRQGAGGSLGDQPLELAEPLDPFDEMPGDHPNNCVNLLRGVK